MAEQAPGRSSPLTPDTSSIASDRYVIVRTLAVEASSVTYEALDRTLDRRVVIKEYFPATLCERVDARTVRPLPDQEALFERGRQRFIAEVRQLARLRHASLVHVLAVLEENGTAYMLMEHEEGGSLADWLSRLGRLPTQAELDRITRDVMAALGVLHEGGQLHGDVSPSQIIVRTDGTAVLLAPARYRDLLDAAVGGMRATISEPYVPPEQYAVDERIRGPWTDVYGLAATLHQAVVGTAPVDAARRMLELEQSQLAAFTMQGRGYRPEFLEAIDAGLELRPRDRPQSVAEMGALAGVDAPGDDLQPADLPLDTAGPALSVEQMQQWTSALASGRSGRLEPRRMTGRSRFRIEPMGAARDMAASAGPSRRSAVGWLVAGTLVAAAAGLAANFYLRSGSGGTGRGRSGLPSPKARSAGRHPSGDGGLAPLAGLAMAADTGASVSPGEPVEMTVFAPERAAPGTSVLVQVFLHVTADAVRAMASARVMDAVAARRGTRTLEVDLVRGARVDIVLACSGAEVDEPVQTVRWRGDPVFAQFLVAVPADAGGVKLTPVVRVSVAGDLVGRIVLRLPVEAGARPAAPAPQGEQAGRYRRVFVSYASEDRRAVLERVQMLQATRTDFFQDILTLDPGQRWERELWRQIDACDLFLLFWSSAARRSEWVLKEVEYALGRQTASPDGAPDIVPVILEGPPPVLPPASLGALHFDDRIRYFIAAS